MNTPLITDAFLPADLYKEVMELIRHAPWRYGAKSNAETDPHGHLTWKVAHDRRENLADLTDQLTGTLAKVWSHVKAKLPDHLPVRVYANAYSYGMDGYFHTDSRREGEITAILYVCDGWQPDWAGETCCYDNKGTYWAILPAANRLLMLPSNMQHAARAVSRKFMGIRSVLVFKTRPRRTEPFERMSQWLAARGALKFDHAKGSLHDHLMRTYQLLVDKKIDLNICLGGALHSIYGTNIYKQQLLEPNQSNRNMVMKDFGKRAEEYAYAFATLERPKILETIVGTGWAERPEIRGVCLIEAANLADQDSLDKWPKLSKLWSET